LCNRDHVRQRQTQTERVREIALGSIPTHRETNKTTTRSTPSHGGPREGREGDLGPVHDRHNRRVVLDSLSFSFPFFFGCVACPPSPPSLSVSFFLSSFLCWIASFLPSLLPFFLRRRFFFFCFAPVSALQMAAGAYLFQHNLQLRGRKSNTY
jgi:hypothetical protein